MDAGRTAAFEFQKVISKIPLLTSLELHGLAFTASLLAFSPAVLECGHFLTKLR
jgi:hypothetical protein